MFTRDHPPSHPFDVLHVAHTTTGGVIGDLRDAGRRIGRWTLFHKYPDGPGY